MSKGKGNEYRPLSGLERELSELGKLRLREATPRPVQVSEYDKELPKFARNWASKCAKPLREYCQRVLTQLGKYFTQDSIAAILNEALSRGLSIEPIIILLSQCSLTQYDDSLTKYYLDTGKVDIDQLHTTLQSQGVAINPEELRAIVEGNKAARKGNNKLSWLPKLLKR